MKHLGISLWVVAIVFSGLYLGYRAHQGIQFRTDLMALLPSQQQDAATQRVDDEVSAAVARKFVLLVGDADPAQARLAAAELGRHLTQAGLVHLSMAAIDHERLAALGKLYFPYRAGLIDAADRQLLRDGKQDELADNAVAKLYGFFATVGAQQIRHDPFLLMTDFLLSLPLPQSKLHWDDGLLSTQTDGTTWVMLTGTITGAPFALEFQRQLSDGLDSGMAMISAAHPHVELLRLGAVFFAKAGADQAMGETNRFATISTIATVVLVLLVFRAIGPLWLTLLAMGSGILAALSATLLLFGEPHVMALLFGVSLIGVVVDYSLQYCTEIFATPPDTPAARLRRVRVGISIGTATTMIGYLALLFAPFPGLRQIAVFSAVGLFVSWLSVVALFPLLDRTKTPSHGRALLRIAGRFAAPWERQPLPRWLRWAVVAVGLIVLAGWLHLTPDDDVRRMQSLSPRLLAEQNRITGIIGKTGGGQIFAVEAADDETALLREEALIERLTPLLGTCLDGFQAFAQYVPSQARQHENRALVERLLGADALGRQGRRLGVQLDDATANEMAAPLTPAQALAGPLAFLADLVVPAENGRVVHLVSLDGARRLDLLADAARGIDGVRLIDPAGDFSALIGKYRVRALLLMVVSVVFMAPPLVWRYGWRRGAIVLVPPLIAVMAAPAIRSLAGGGFTFFDAIAQVLILSIGVDYAVFCAETTAERRSVTMFAVGLAALAALASFGLLAFSSVAAVHNFGLTMSLGIAASFLLAPMARVALPGGGTSESSGHWAGLAERGTSWGLHFVTISYRLLGRSLCCAILHPIALFFYVTAANRRRWTWEYLARVSRATGLRQRPWRDGFRLYLNFAVRALDSFIGLRHPERVGTFHIIGDDVLADYVKAGAGGVLIVSHHGNAELCRTTLSAQFGQVVNVLLHTKQAVRYNELLKSIRPDFLAHTIQVSEIGPNTAVDLMARVERGEWIAIAGDRPPLTGVERTSWVPFLGDPAPFSQGPYVLASLLGCPVFLLFCVRTGEGHTVHVEHFADKIDLPRRQKEPALAELAARYARRLEHHCLSAPDQWYNFFDFWGSPTRQDNQGNDVG